MPHSLDSSGLPRLASMYLTHGHRIPAELISGIEPAAAHAASPAQWECPLDATRQYGRDPGDTVRLTPPTY